MLFPWDGPLRGLSGPSLLNERCDGLENKSYCFSNSFYYLIKSEKHNYSKHFLKLKSLRAEKVNSYGKRYSIFILFYSTPTDGQTADGTEITKVAAEDGLKMDGATNTVVVKMKI